MVAGRCALVMLAAGALALLAPLAAAAEPPMQAIQFHLHRNGALDAAPPVAPDAAAWVFGLAGQDSIEFASAPFAEPWVIRGPAALTFTVALQAGIGGGLTGILKAAGAPVAVAHAAGPLLPGAQEVRLDFGDFRATIPAGQRLGLMLVAAPAVDPADLGLDLDAPPGTVNVDPTGLTGPLGLGDLPSLGGDVGQTLDDVTGLLGLDLGLGGLLGGLGLPGVDLRPQVPDLDALGPVEGALVGAVIYDAVTHPATLGVVRELPAPPAPVPPAADPDPTPPVTGGPDPGRPIGGPDPGAETPIGPALGAPAAAGFDPFLALVGVGTAAIAALSGIVLRGRDVHG